MEMTRDEVEFHATTPVTTPPPCLRLEAARHERRRRPPVTQLRVLRSEWVKLRSLRSTALTLLAAVVVMVALGWLFGWATKRQWSELRPDEQASFSPVDTTLAGYYLAQLAVGVLGVLLVTGEYATGMIKATFGAVPRRLPVLWAKAVLYAVVTFALMLAAVARRLPRRPAAARHARDVAVRQRCAARDRRGGRLPRADRGVLGGARLRRTQHRRWGRDPLRAAARRTDPRACCSRPAGATTCCPTCRATPAPRSSACTRRRTACRRAPACWSWWPGSSSPWPAAAVLVTRRDA